jgi:hypothetical protein
MRECTEHTNTDVMIKINQLRLLYLTDRNNKRLHLQLQSTGSDGCLQLHRFSKSATGRICTFQGIAGHNLHEQPKPDPAALTARHTSLNVARPGIGDMWSRSGAARGPE